MDRSLNRRLANHAQRKRHANMVQRWQNDCEPADPANTVTERLNSLLRNGGEGYILNLCPNQRYLILEPIRFAHNNQEITTLGYPTSDERATLVVNGVVADGKGHTVAVDGTCSTCSGVKLRNVQIDGTRDGQGPTFGGGNIEMGGDNKNQLIEYVRSYNPRSWSCLHIAEGSLGCNGVIIQNNDIGPCGSDTFQEWADGISLSCRNAIVRNNIIQGATDGGIVIFGAPGSQIYNNTIWAVNTLLGGINMVDYDPWGGDFTGTVVHDNIIFGGFATDDHENTDAKGTNGKHTIIKIGVAVGPRTWFGDRFGESMVRNGFVVNNNLTGAFTYGVAVTSASNFTVEGNRMMGNTSFIGAPGPHCSPSDTVPLPAPLLVDQRTTESLKLQGDFQQMSDGDSLTCVILPNGGNFWPYRLSSNSSAINVSKSTLSKRNSTGIALAVIFGVMVCCIGSWMIRKWYIMRRESRPMYKVTHGEDYLHQIHN